MAKNGKANDETAERNALQVLFLNDAFCVKFCKAANLRKSDDDYFSAEFEKHDIDVFFHINDTYDIKIEIKPTIGDDYPAMLRQMRRNKSHILFLKNYKGQGATREQFIQIFKQAEISVVFLKQCI